MLTVYQTSGKLFDASKEIWSAVKENNFSKAVKVYESVTGEKVLDHNRENYTWLMFCATDVVKRWDYSYQLYQTLERKYKGDLYYISTVLKDIATKEFGGFWSVVDEY